MKRYLMILFILFVQCGNLLGEDDASNFLEPQHITGEWYQVKEVPSDVAGLYRKDTVIYMIGLDSLSDYIKFVDRRIYDPLTFKVIYPRGGTKFGYLEKPKDDFRDFDYDRQESILNYILYLGLPEMTTKYQASFRVPNGYASDTLSITVESDKFGLKKKGL